MTKRSDIEMRSQVLQLFRDPASHSRSGSVERLWAQRLAEWQRLLHWLDTSGLALYFLARMEELACTDRLPAVVLDRLRQSLRQNTEKNRELMEEAGDIQRAFDDRGVACAVMKGFSLWPHSVPDPSLRSQLDLDFLITPEHASAAQAVLESMGYFRHAVSGSTWEFKTHQEMPTALGRLYARGTQRSIELHLASTPQAAALLDRSVTVAFRSIRLSVMAPVDIFLGQALHLHKHIHGEFCRAAHVLEFWRHCQVRRDDHAFWTQLRQRACEEASMMRALATSFLLTEELIGDAAPVEVAAWSSAALTPAARLWISRYAARAVLADFPGSKLYLLLQKAQENERLLEERGRLTRGMVIPRRLPPPLSKRAPDESVRARLRRQRLYVWWIGFRLRFHVVQGLRLLLELPGWNRQLRKLAE